MELNTLIYLALAALTAFAVKRLTIKIGIPIVTGYVIAGVIMGISFLKIYHIEVLDRLDIINDLALGIIGFTIGSELNKELFKKLGKSILFIAMLESLGAFLLVFFFVYLVEPGKIYQALIFGSVASATAPAATVYVIQQYKAKGPLSSTILAVVGIDDAFALIIFVFASTLSKSILTGSHISLLHLLESPFIEIGLSLLLGIGTGLLFILLFRNVRFPDDLLLVVAAFLMLILGVASKFQLSGLLATMTFGSVTANMNSALTHRSLKITDNVSPILFAYFFIFAGSHLDVTLLPRIGLLGLIYLVSRTAGKMGGARLGAILGKAAPSVKKFIGVALIPQVGVAIALAIMVREQFGNGDFGQAGIDLSLIVINILLFTTIVTEVAGPLLTKRALIKAGECETPVH
ncbi:cation:proton antiporter [bacterium]|nr:cation:proton antiporter [bacterium]